MMFINRKKFKNILYISLCSIAVFVFLSCADIDIPVFPSMGSKLNMNLGDNSMINSRSIVALSDEWAKRFSLDTAFILAVIKQESGFNPEAKSRAGALGLMQLMPGTISYINSSSGITIQDPSNPYQNIGGGTWYLNKIYSQFLMYPDSWKYALSAYNCGLNCLKNAEKTALEDYKKLAGYKPAFLAWEYVSPYLPFETQNYVPAVFAHYNVYSNPKLCLKTNSKKQLIIQNKSNFPVSLRDWKLKNYYGKEYKFTSRIISPNQEMEVDNKIRKNLSTAKSKSTKLALINPEGKTISNN